MHIYKRGSTFAHNDGPVLLVATRRGLGVPKSRCWLSVDHGKDRLVGLSLSSVNTHTHIYICFPNLVRVVSAFNKVVRHELPVPRTIQEWESEARLNNVPATRLLADRSALPSGSKFTMEHYLPLRILLTGERSLYIYVLTRFYYSFILDRGTLPAVFA